jgi:UDP-GlcNAc3NAcA epimerase
MKILTVIGARPQFVKASVLSKELKKHQIDEWLIHTGQHYDTRMSNVFFDELNMKKPDINLAIGSGSHGTQTGQMIEQIETQIISQNPDWVLIYGDTNSTLAAAISAVKLNIPIAHVEAGLRSFNKEMPEEHNRILSDHCSKLLLCPTQNAVNNLKNEGLTDGVFMVGDVMFDAVQEFLKTDTSNIAINRSNINEEYLVATIHRPYNTDIEKNLIRILKAFSKIPYRIILPIHPRTKKRLEDLPQSVLNEISTTNLRIIDPVGYYEMLDLVKNSKAVLTDSGGLQKEAMWLKTPCVTLRSETEWIETVNTGWNEIVGNDTDKILNSINNLDNRKLSDDGISHNSPCSQIAKLLKNTH